MDQYQSPGIRRLRAICIGINYWESGAEEFGGPLLYAQRDAEQVARVLKDVFCFEEIIVMTDTKATPHRLRPTYINIRTQLTLFSENAEPDSGHAHQIPCLDRSERDGFNELIIPEDYRKQENQLHRIVLDDTLHRFLVRDFPRECKLTAVFDTCHSGTLMDLPHMRCNRIWAPWTVVEKMDSDIYSASATQESDTKSISIISSDSSPIVEKVPIDYSPPSEHISSCLRIPIMRCDSPLAMLVHELASVPQSYKPARPMRQPLRRKSINVPAGHEYLTDQTSQLVEVSTRECNGWCRCDDPPIMKSHIICLSACRDSELSYEDGDTGLTMTAILLDILRRNPRPTFEAILTSLTYQLYECALEVNEEAKRLNEQDKKRGNIPRRPTSSFTTPQLSSVYPLNMNDMLDI